MVPPFSRMQRSHLISARGTDFRFWRWFLLRSAGFPYELLESFASEALGAAATRVLEACAAASAAQEAATSTLATLRMPSREAWRALRDLFKEAREGHGAESSRAPEEAQPVVRSLASAAREQRDAEAAYASLRASELQRTRARLREVLQGDLREALLLQSRGAFRAVERLPPASAPRNHQVKRDEQTAVLHVQRCCAKNDTISFFGPIASGAVDGGAGHVSLVPSEALVAKRRTFFEQWAIRAFADAVAADAAVRPHLRPRLSPRVRLEGEVLVVPVDRRSELPGGYARLLARCDGTRTELALARELAGSAAFPAEADVREALEELREAGAVLGQVEVPTATWEPERALREELMRLPLEVGAPWLRRLDALEAARAAFADPRGSLEAEGRQAPDASRTPRAELPVPVVPPVSAPDAHGETPAQHQDADTLHFARADVRAAALDRLGEVFAEATHLSATRGGGKFYEARAAVYEDCVRDLRDLRLGGDFLERVAPALDLVLGSARWYALELEARAMAAARAVLQEIGAERVDYTRFLVAFKKRFTAEDAAAAEVELQRRWRAALDLGDLSRPRVERSAEELRARLDLSHALRAPRWGHGRYHSPDLMVSASSLEAFARGEYQVVLGEVHACANTVNAPVWMAVLAERAEAAAAMAADAERWVAPVPEPEAASRVAAYLLENPALVEVETGRAPSRLPRERVVALGELEVVGGGDEPAVRTRDGRYSFHLLELLDFGMSALHQAGLDLLGGGEPHRPRVTVEGLVLSREQWTLPGPGRLAPEADPFLEVRRWARAAGLPRRFFARVPGETKPLCVDLDSPLLVEAFARMAGASVDQGPLRLSEMLPAPEALWLPDAAGRRYTAELRLVAVDPRCVPARSPAPR